MIRTQRNETIAYCQKYLVLMLLSVVFYNNSMYGQLRKSQPIGDPQPQFRNFSVKEGLPSSETYFVHQDKKGYIWICTDRGVARYDGYRFRVFTKKDGLTDNVVFKIVEDKAGRVWFVTLNSMLCYYENNRIIPYKYNDRIRHLIQKNRIVSKNLYINEKGDITYSLFGSGYFQIRSNGEIDRSEFKLEENKVMLLDFGDAIIASGETNLHSSKTAYLEPTKVYKVNSGKSKKYLGILTMARGISCMKYNDRLFVLTHNDLFVIYREEIKQLTFSKEVLSMRIVDSHLWLGTVRGAIRFQLKNNTFQLEKEFTILNNRSVTSILNDSNGGLWFSTLETGVFYVGNISVRNYTSKQGLLFDAIFDINGIKDDVFICNVYGMYQGLKTSGIYSSFHLASEGYRFLKFNNKIYFPGNNCFKRPESIRHLEKDEDVYEFKARNELLVLCISKIFRLDKKLKYTEVIYDNPYEMEMNRYFRQLSVNDEGIIYLGSDWGVEVLRNRKVEQVGNDSLFSEPVRDMLFDPLWKNVVATSGQGVFCFDEANILYHLTEKNGLCSNTINQILIDENHNLWITTNSGLSVCKLLKNGKYQITNYTMRNGLVSNEISGLYSWGHNVWVATKNGVSLIDLSEKQRIGSDSGLFLERIYVAGKGVYQRSQLPELGSGLTFVKIVLGTTDFRSSGMSSFRYRFKKEDEWAYSSTPEIVLNNPGSNDYQCEVSYRLNTGKWSQPKIICRFTVLPPFYATWYFISGMILFGMFGMYLLFRMRLRQVKRKHDLKDTINQLEQKALRAQMNPHFIFNSLNSIQSFLIYEENEKAEKYLLKFAQLIRITLNNSRETYISIDAEIDSLKRYLELEQMRFKDKFTFEIHNGLTPEELQYGVPPMLIQPFVENAVLHGFKSVQSGGVITLRFISLSNGGLDCEVEDNGVGRQATLRHKLSDHKSFGTKITEERLTAFRQKYGDDFSVEIIDKENGEAKGTKVVLRIPVVVPQDLNSTEDI